MTRLLETRFRWWAPEDGCICSRCRIAIPDAWCPMTLHVSHRPEVMHFCVDCVPLLRTDETVLERIRNLPPDRAAPPCALSDKTRHSSDMGTP